jgi:hypothetical protein
MFIFNNCRVVPVSQDVAFQEKALAGSYTSSAGRHRVPPGHCAFTLDPQLKQQVSSLSS